MTAKFAALTAAWLVALIPVLSALIYWKLLGGHLDTSETVILIVGHLLYALLIGAISFLAAALTEGGATAAILALAVTLGSWVLDFAALDRGGVSSALASLSLTSLLRPFEQGLLSIPNVLAMLIVTAGFLALTAIWLPPGTSLGRKLSGSALIIGAAGILIGGAAQVAIVLDVTPDRRNSFPLADEQLLGRLGERLFVTVHMAPSDPRVVDLDRKVLARLKRAMPRVTVRIAEFRPGQPLGHRRRGGLWRDRYDLSRQERHNAVDRRRRNPADAVRACRGRARRRPSTTGLDEPGYPLVADASNSAVWFYGVEPFAFAAAWWLAAGNRRIRWRRS